MPVWWQNTGEKDSGGLRSIEAGMLFLMEKLELATYDIFPDFKITTQVVIFLDKFIDCPIPQQTKD